jgi:hypothetical protein
MAEQLHGPMQHLTRRLVVMEQISSKQNEIDLESNEILYSGKLFGEVFNLANSV